MKYDCLVYIYHSLKRTWHLPESLHERKLLFHQILTGGAAQVQDPIPSNSNNLPSKGLCHFNPQKIKAQQGRLTHQYQGGCLTSWPSWFDGVSLSYAQKSWKIRAGPGIPPTPRNGESRGARDAFSHWILRYVSKMPTKIETCVGDWKIWETTLLKKGNCTISKLTTASERMAHESPQKVSQQFIWWLSKHPWRSFCKTDQDVINRWHVKRRPHDREIPNGTDFMLQSPNWQ